MATRKRPAAGTRVRLSRVGWPERRGLVATVVDTAGAEAVYPVHGLQRSEVIVHLEHDPLAHGRGPIHRLANGEPWSCVVHLPDVDLEEAPS